MSKTVLCDNLKAGLDRFRPFPPETLASLRNYYRVGLTWSSNALEGNSLTESNLIPFPEYREIIAQLKHIAAKGEELLVVVPKLITMDEAAQMLGVSLANFKKQEPYLPSKRKYVGHGIRYRNTDIIRYILSDDPQSIGTGSN